MSQRQSSRRRRQENNSFAILSKSNWRKLELTPFLRRAGISKKFVSKNAFWTISKNIRKPIKQLQFLYTNWCTGNPVFQGFVKNIFFETSKFCIKIPILLKTASLWIYYFCSWYWPTNINRIWRFTFNQL